MERFLTFVYDASGNKLDGVTVTIKKAGTGTNATLFSDDGITSKANPFTNDSDGSFEFRAANGLYDIVLAKAGKTFTDDNSAAILLYDPRDDAGAAMVRDDFNAIFITGSDLLSGGYHYRFSGGVSQVVSDTTYRSGWVNVVESGAAAGHLTMCDSANNTTLLFGATSDLQMMELRVEKVGDAVAGTRRVGLTDVVFTSGDPANGIYIRQIDTNNAFLVTRSSSSEATRDLGQTLNNPTRIRVLITSGSLIPIVDGVAKTALTTLIPTSMLGFSAHGGATGSAAGLRLDYLNLITTVRL